MRTGCSKVAGTLAPLALTAFTRTLILSPEPRSWIAYRVERKGSLFTAVQSVPTTNPKEHIRHAMDRHPQTAGLSHMECNPEAKNPFLAKMEGFGAPAEKGVL